MALMQPNGIAANLIQQRFRCFRETAGKTTFTLGVSGCAPGPTDSIDVKTVFCR